MTEKNHTIDSGQFIVVGFQGGELVVGEVSKDHHNIHEDPYTVGFIMLSRALRIRETPVPIPDRLGGVHVRVETPIVEFLPSGARKVEDVIRPIRISLRRAHWYSYINQAEFDTFLQSVGAPPTTLVVPQISAKVIS